MTAITAMDQKSSLKTWLFNPFYYVAGGPALALGLAVVMVASLGGAISNSHFDGVFDFHTGAEVPLWLYIVEGLVDWLSAGLVLWLAGLMLSKSRIRVVDVFGTQALARFPSLITVVLALLPGYQRATNSLAHFDFQIGLADAVTFGIAVIAMLVVIVWMIILMYRAFAVSCNVKGAKAIIGFIVASLVAETVSKLVLSAMFGLVLR